MMLCDFTDNDLCTKFVVYCESLKPYLDNFCGRGGVLKVIEFVIKTKQTGLKTWNFSRHFFFKQKTSFFAHVNKKLWFFLGKLWLLEKNKLWILFLYLFWQIFIFEHVLKFFQWDRLQSHKNSSTKRISWEDKIRSKSAKKKRVKHILPKMSTN